MNATEFVPQTRAEKRIVRAANEKGYSVTLCEYSNDRTNYEMVGYTDGWSVVLEPEPCDAFGIFFPVIGGYSYTDVLIQIAGLEPIAQTAPTTSERGERP